MSNLINLCQKLVKFASTSGHSEEVFSFLQNLFNENNFNVRLLHFNSKNGKSIPSLCACYGSGHPHLLFVGHIDVVNAGNIDDWRYPPFEANICDNVLYGRGIADMKGGVACFIQACKTFIESYQFNGKVTIILSGDEEEPIIEGTNQILKTLNEEGEKFDFALVGEPSNPKTMGDEIKIGRRGDIVFHITSLGEPGHTAYTDCSANPVHRLINLLSALQQNKLDCGNDYFGPSTMHVTTFDVGNSATNVVPAKATATIDIRFNSEHTYQSIEKWLNMHLDNNFEVKADYIGESFLSPIDNNIRALKEIVQKHTGKEPKYSTAGGTSDARFVKNYCPVAEYGLTNNTIHQVNECETISNINILYNVYLDFLVKFFKYDAYM